MGESSKGGYYRKAELKERPLPPTPPDHELEVQLFLTLNFNVVHFLQAQANVLLNIYQGPGSNLLFSIMKKYIK